MFSFFFSFPKDAKKSIYVEEESSPWGNPGFASVGEKEAHSTSAYDWGDPNSEDFFSSLISDKKVRYQSECYFVC